MSGVPGLPDGFQLTVHVDVQHLGRYFVRFDKFATLTLRFNGSTLVSNTAAPGGQMGTFTYSDGTSTSTPPLDSAKSVRLEDIMLTFSDPSSGLHTTTTSRILVRALAHNIYQASSTSNYDRYGIPTVEGLALDDAAEEQLYVDTVSSRYLAAHFDQAAGTTVHHPSRKRLGSGDTPAVSQASDHAAYDEEEDLSTTDELQFVNGRFRTKQDSDAYLNYASAFLEPTPSVTMPNYESVSGTGYRYATFEFDLSSASSSTINHIDVKLYDYTLASPQNSTGTIPDFKLFVKLIDGGSYTPQSTGSSYTSIWLDGNAVLATAVGRTQANYSNASLEPLAVLEPSSTGNTNTSDTKRLILATGTSTSSLKILVRVGLDMSLNHSLGRVELQTA